MIVRDDDNIVIACETFAIVGEKIMPVATGESSSVHVDHDRAFMGSIDLLCPKIKTQTVLARHSDRSASMKHKCVFIGVCQVFAVGIKVRRVVSWTDAAILQSIANPFPGLRPGRREEAPRTGGRGAVGHAFEHVNAVPFKSTDFPRSRFCDRCSIGRNHLTSSAGYSCGFWI
jgi:hypothetical protein